MSSRPHSRPSHTQVQSPPLVFFKILLLVNKPKSTSHQEALLEVPSLPGPFHLFISMYHNGQQRACSQVQISSWKGFPWLLRMTVHAQQPSFLCTAFCFSGTACPCSLCTATIPPSEDLKPSCHLPPATRMCLWKLSLWSQGRLQRTQAQLTGEREHPNQHYSRRACSLF